MIKRLREQQDLSQDELAKKAKLTKPYISQLESGARRNPSVATVRSLARALGIDTKILLGEEQLRLPIEPSPATLPPAFVHFKDLFRIHLKQILKLDRKPPMHAATLLILVAYETLSKLLGRAEKPHDVFAQNLVDRRQVPYHVGEVLFNALRDGLAHAYRPHRIVVGREEIALVLAWKNAAPVHLKMVGARLREGHLHLVTVKESEERHPRLCIVVEELWKDLDALFADLAIQLQSDPALAASVETNARAVLAGEDRRRRPQGPALKAWAEFVQRAEWEGRPS